MAKVMVEINIHNQSYEQLKELLLKHPDPGWFQDRDPSTHRVVIDEAYLNRDAMDDDFFVFQLIGVRP